MAIEPKPLVATEPVNIRVPQDVLEQLDAYCKFLGGATDRTYDRRDRRARGGRTDVARLSERLVRSVGQLALGRPGAAARSLPGVAGRVGRLPRDVVEAVTAAEQLALRIAFNLLSRFMPAPLRPAAEFVRRLGRVIPRG
jgi:hypothetical protein